jgi:steroid delta-isomerase-like uncharacterized protein
MTRKELRLALQRYADAKNRHDIEAIVALRSDDCVDESMALGTRIEGKTALREFFTGFFASIPDYYGEFEGTAYGDDTVTVWGRWGGTLTDDLMGIQVESGRELKIPVAFVCTFRDGLLVRDAGYFDAVTLADQAGLPMAAIRPRSATPFPPRPRRRQRSGVG